MPLPLGHAAVGWAAYETIQPPLQSGSHHRTPSHIARFAYITILANLPDIDVLFGLFFYGNGAAIHRGPTHSLLFALLAGYLASNLWRLWHRIPRYSFGLCFALVCSHVLADMFLTTASVSLLWPLELNLVSGYRGWGQVVHMVLFQSVQDIGIIAFSLIYVYVLRFVRGYAPIFSRFSVARWRIKN